MADNNANEKFSLKDNPEEFKKQFKTLEGIYNDAKREDLADFIEMLTDSGAEMVKVFGELIAGEDIYSHYPELKDEELTDEIKNALIRAEIYVKTFIDFAELLKKGDTNYKTSVCGKLFDPESYDNAIMFLNKCYSKVFNRNIEKDPFKSELSINQKDQVFYKLINNLRKGVVSKNGEPETYKTYISAKGTNIGEDLTKFLDSIDETANQMYDKYGSDDALAMVVNYIKLNEKLL